MSQGILRETVWVVVEYDVWALELCRPGLDFCLNH